MLLNLIVSLVRIKLKSNNFNLCSGNMKITFIQKQYDRKTLLFSKTNYPVGSNLNRDQKTTKKHQINDSEKITKRIKSCTVEVAWARNQPGPLSARAARAFGPTADGQAAKPARRRAPLGPNLALSPPRRPLTVRSESDGRPRASREQNRRRPALPEP